MTKQMREMLEEEAREVHKESYHLQSIRSAFVREWMGGVPAVNSHLFIDAIGALLDAGLSEDEIVLKYKEAFPR